jgi:hypothetical protein
MGIDVAADRGEDGVPAARVADVTLEPIDARRDWVDVSVLEARDEEAPVKIDDPRPRPPELLDLLPRPYGDDPLGADRNGLRPRPAVVDRVDVAAGEEEVGGIFA